MADLEAVRLELGTDRMILLGGSWGGTLASDYKARDLDRLHPEVHEESVGVFSIARLMEVEEAAHSVAASPRYREILRGLLVAKIPTPRSVGDADAPIPPEAS